MSQERTPTYSFDRFKWREVVATTVAVAALTACGSSGNNTVESAPATAKTSSLPFAEAVCRDLEALTHHLRYSEEPYTTKSLVFTFSKDAQALVTGVEGQKFVTGMQGAAHRLPSLAFEAVLASDRNEKLEALDKIETIATDTRIDNC